MTVLTVFWVGQATASAMPTLEEMLEDKVLGDPKAPVTIVEYASLGCPHCKQFHEETLPRIKKKYVASGKVKVIFRDFPLGQRAMAASMVARCAGPVRYFAMVDVLFRDQAVWGRAEDGMAALIASAKKLGMSEAQVDSCLRNEGLLQGLRKIAEDAHNTHGVASTPSFLVQGQKVEGAQPFDAFEQLIQRALREKS
ncbi:MAG: DsbA family protein [Rhodospirillaceae bacterium]